MASRKTFPDQLWTHCTAIPISMLIGLMCSWKAIYILHYTDKVIFFLHQNLVLFTTSVSSHYHYWRSPSALQSRLQRRNAVFSSCLALFHRCCAQCLSCRHAAPSVFVLVAWNTCCKVTPDTTTAAQLLMFMLRCENVVQTQPLLTSRCRSAESRKTQKFLLNQIC